MDLKKWAEQVQKDLGLDSEETMAHLAEAANEEFGDQTTIEFKRTNETLTEEFKQFMIQKTARSIYKWEAPATSKIPVFVAQSKMPNISDVQSAFESRTASSEKTRIASKLIISQIDSFIKAINNISGKDGELLDHKKAYIRINWESGNSILNTKEGMIGHLQMERTIAVRIMEKAKSKSTTINRNSSSQPQYKGKSVEISFGGIKSIFGKFRKK